MHVHILLHWSEITFSNTFVVTLLFFFHIQTRRKIKDRKYFNQCMFIEDENYFLKKTVRFCHIKLDLEGLQNILTI